MCWFDLILGEKMHDNVSIVYYARSFPTGY